MTGESSSDARGEALRLSYQQICASYHGITEFRGRLLTLLPLATGTGVFLLLQQKPQNLKYLAPIGLFGVVVTLGLFMYELRGIQRCHGLEDQGKTVEERLHLSLDEGQFRGQPPRGLNNMLGPPGAGLVVYIAVMFAWLYVAGVGGYWWDDGFPPAWILLPLYVVAVLVAWFTPALLTKGACALRRLRGTRRQGTPVH